MPVDRTIRLWSMAALMVSALAVSGCSTSIADLPGVGLPSDAPQRPKEAAGYLPVHDLPPDRDAAAMKPAEHDIMRSVEDSYWWYQALRRHVVEDYLSNKGQSPSS